LRVALNDSRENSAQVWEFRTLGNLAILADLIVKLLVFGTGGVCQIVWNLTFVTYRNWHGVLAKVVSFRLVEVVDFQYDINFGKTLISPGWE
jgi:hypothetical protein